MLCITNCCIESITSSALRKQQKILACFPEDKLNTINPDLQIQALNASCFLLEHQWRFEAFLIVVFESLNCPRCEKMNLKIIRSLLENQRLCRSWMMFLKNRAQLNCSEQTRDSWTTIIKHKNSRASSRDQHTVLWTLRTIERGYFHNFSYLFLSCGLNVNILYVKYLTQDSPK